MAFVSSAGHADYRSARFASVDKNDEVHIHDNDQEQEQRREILHQDLLNRTLQDAGQFAYGTKMVELWVWDASLSKLFRPEGGWWIDPYWHRHNAEEAHSCPFCQLVDKSHHDYIAPPMFSPGVGIPGVLWSDLGNDTGRATTPLQRRGQPTSSSPGESGAMDANFMLRVLGNRSYNVHRNALTSYLTAAHQQQQHIAASGKDHLRIAWRDVKALAEDPDQPRSHRLQAIASTDLRWTSGVPFRIKGQEGVVVYYARAEVNLDKLQDKTNTDYLIHAADFIGSAWSLRLPRAALMIRRHDEIARNFRRLRRALIMLVRAGVALDDLVASVDSTDNSSRRTTSLQGTPCASTEATRCDILLRTKFHNKAKQFLVKLRGGGTLAPPPASWKQSTLTAVGVLLTLLTLSVLSRAFSASFGTAYQFPLPPMAALLALQFGLTAAPAAQPKTIMIGQLLSIGTALVVAEIPTSYLQVWMKQSLACAIAVLLMSKTCIVNPPAAANAFVFADGTWQWTSLVTALVGSIIAILYSVLINNLSEKRQYPSSWGIPQVLRCIKKQPQKPTQYASRLESILRTARARQTRKSTSLTDSATEHPLNNRSSMNPISGSSGEALHDTASVSDVESGVATPTT
ncbi:hypothetical protein MHU86_16774 [Fragilaria crotonensis]|nr:hypothetical protein MHU86_16774 [Fragilaria crotonensis]